MRVKDLGFTPAWSLSLLCKIEMFAWGGIQGLGLRVEGLGFRVEG